MVQTCSSYVVFFIFFFLLLFFWGGSTQDGPKHVLPKSSVRSLLWGWVNARWTKTCSSYVFFQFFVLGAGDGRWSKTCSAYSGFSCFLLGESGDGMTQDGPKHVLPMCFPSVFLFLVFLGGVETGWPTTCSSYAFCPFSSSRGGGARWPNTCSS